MSSAVDHTVRLPASALTLLSRRCAALGPDGVRALRESGYRAGADLYSALGRAPEACGLESFWERVNGLVGDLGLGEASFYPVDASLGVVAWRRCPEAVASRAGGELRNCHFVAGLLGGVLSRAAGRTVAVIEGRCRAGSDQPCWFLFGTVDRLRELGERPGAASLHGILAPD